MKDFLTTFRGEVHGYTGGAVELQFTPKGKAVAKVSVGVGGGDGRPAKWVRLVFWEDSAELVNKVLTEKGMPIIAYGRVDAKAYLSKGGEARNELTLTVDRLEVIESSGKAKEISLSGEPEV